MSAVNIILQPHRGLIFTDAAAYDEDGMLVALIDKCHLISDGKLALTGRGNVVFQSALAKGLNGWTIDEIEADEGAILEEYFAIAEPMLERVSSKTFNNVFLVGWSDRDQKPKLAQWANCPPDGMARFVMREDVIAPEPDHAALAAAAARSGLKQTDPDFKERVGLVLMHAQRLSPGVAEFAAEGKFLVGGHVQMTEVTAKGITKRIVHTWPEDRIGERIRPAPALDPIAHANVTPLDGLNRQQRRALERQRKGAA